MNRARALAALDESFARHMDKLVEVLMTNLTFDKSKSEEYFANFHRGLSLADEAHTRSSTEFNKVFPE